MIVVIVTVVTVIVIVTSFSKTTNLTPRHQCYVFRAAIRNLAMFCIKDLHLKCLLDQVLYILKLGNNLKTTKMAENVDRNGTF